MTKLVSPTTSDGSFTQQAWQRNQSRPRELGNTERETERQRCAADPVYFINTYCHIYDSVTQGWIPFKLWTAQVETVRLWQESKYLVVLKARQEGFTWLLGVALVIWLMLFAPIAEILIFSQGEEEAKKLLTRIVGTPPIRGMYDYLPSWMKEPIVIQNTSEFRLANGSGVQALPATRGGRSNAATYVLVDEADFVEGLSRLIGYAKPTIDAGKNKMAVCSTANDEVSDSFFQRLYKGARDGSAEDADWKAVFYSWNANPLRTVAWYEKEKQSSFNANGSYDMFFKQYPATDTEALSARTINVRYPPQFLSALSRAYVPPERSGAPLVSGLKVFIPPISGRTYGIGADPAGGLTDSDDSAACVVDAGTLEQVAAIQGKIEPTQFANHVFQLSAYYFRAPVLFELNNHGHAFLAQAREVGMALRMGLNPRGRTENEPGWVTSERSKNNLYDNGMKAISTVLAETKDNFDVLHVESSRKILFDQKTIAQLGSIDVNTLRAPEGAHDDAAMAWVLAVMCVFQGSVDIVQVYHDFWKETDLPVSTPLPQMRKANQRWPDAFPNQAAVFEKLRQRGLTPR